MTESTNTIRLDLVVVLRKRITMAATTRKTIGTEGQKSAARTVYAILMNDR